MTGLIPSARWTPVDLTGWTRRAHGRTVMFHSEGGTLKTTLRPDGAPGQIYLRGEIAGRMLVEAYCNGVQVMDELITNEEIDCFIDLGPFAKAAQIDVELHLIPATYGEVRLTRAVELVADGGVFTSRLRALREPGDQPSKARSPA